MTNTPVPAAADREDAEPVMLSLFSPEGLADPYPAYARLRELSPVHWSESLKMWAISRFDDCREVLFAHDRFPVIDEEWLETFRPGWRDSFSSRRMYSLLPFRNPPEHTRLRSLLQRDFTSHRVEAMRPLVERVVARVLDELARHCAGGETVNFQQVVSAPLTTSVIGDMLGIPAEDQPRFPLLTNAIAPLVDPRADSAAVAAADAASREYYDYVHALIEQRRAAPGTDLLSALLSAHQDSPERLSEIELADAVFLLFSAGFETTMTVLGNGVFGLLGHRDQFRLLARDPSLGARAAEEMVRWGASVHMQKRIAGVATEIGGTAIPAGATLIVLLGAANRDPARFTDPERFDITRDEGRALTFGGGIHLCFGASLARLEIAVLAVELARRFPTIELAGPTTFRRSANIRKLENLPVRVTGNH